MKLPTKAWIHKSGKIVEIPDDNFLSEDHGVYAAQHPEKFGMTRDEMKSEMGSDREYYQMFSGKKAWSPSLNKVLNDRGYMRMSRSVEKFDDGSRHHNIMISHESSGAHPHDFIEPLKMIKPHLEGLEKNHSFSVMLSGFKPDKKERNQHLEQSGIPAPAHDHVGFGDINKINKYIGETGGKVSREPEKAASVPSSTELRAAIGPKPETMTGAEYNFYRTIGDSYEPCKFNALLEKIGKCKKRKRMLYEAGGKKILGANPLQMTTRGLVRHLNRWANFIDVGRGAKHIIIKAKNTGETIHRMTSGDVGPRAAIDVLTSVRNHLKSIGAYKEEKRESKGTVQRRQNVEVEKETTSAMPKRTSDEISARREKLMGIVKEKLGSKKRARIERKIEKLGSQMNQSS